MNPSEILNEVIRFIGAITVTVTLAVFIGEVAYRLFKHLSNRAVECRDAVEFWRIYLEVEKQRKGQSFGSSAASAKSIAEEHLAERIDALRKSLEAGFAQRNIISPPSLSARAKKYLEYEPPRLNEAKFRAALRSFLSLSEAYLLVSRWGVEGNVYNAEPYTNMEFPTS